MCTLADVRLVEQSGNVASEFGIDDYGYATHVIRESRRMEPRNIEQWLWYTWDSLNAPPPYQCSCGRGFSGWLEVVDHCDMYVCRDCQRATRKWDGWDYRCPACDQAANPDYHERNPGYYSH